MDLRQHDAYWQGYDDARSKLGVAFVLTFAFGIIVGGITFLLLFH